MAGPLLTTKTQIPLVRSELVRRHRLLEPVLAGLEGRLLLVSAPAGFGKTTLLSEAVAGGSRPVAWLSLDESDNDPIHFLRYLIAALQTLDAGLGRGAQAALESAGSFSVEAILTALINDVNDLHRKVTLVLDDYHLITTQSVHQALSFLISHQPDNLHLAIASRADPPLPVPRLRGRGQLTEIRQEDLCFSTQEASAFLNQVMGLGLSPADVTALVARTEGWVAGLQMAALALQSQGPSPGPGSPDSAAGFIRGFTGSDRYIMDYLVEEVLQRQPPEIRAFLLQTAILQRLTAPLCDVLLETCDPEVPDTGGLGLPTGSPVSTARMTGLAGSQAILEYLDSSNLFIVPLDHERRWYRYHRLFGDLLRQRLQQAQPSLVPSLHRAASLWYEEQAASDGRDWLMAPAIEHALEAGDVQRAACLVEQVAETTLMRSEVVTFLRWAEALPDDLVQARPSLGLYYAWSLLLAARPLDAVEARLRGMEGGEGLVGERIAPLRAFVAMFQGHLPRAAALSQQALESLPEEDLFLRSVATWCLGMALVLDGDLAAGCEALEQAAQTSRQAGNVMIAVMALCNLGDLQMAQGRLQQAWQTYQRALKAAADARGRSLPIGGMARIGLGEIKREWNQLDEARRCLEEGTAQVRQWGDVGTLDGYISLARIHQAKGDWERAAETLETARLVAVRFDATHLDDLMVEIQQVRLWLARGDVGAARGWLVARGGGPPPDLLQPRDRERVFDYHLQKYQRLIAVRILLAEGRYEDAEALLAPMLVALETWGLSSRRQIEVQNLRALALQGKGDESASLAALEQALSLAESGGFVRIFVDEGQPMAHLLRLAATRGVCPEYARRLLAAFDTTDPRVPGQPHPAAVDQPLVEPLSARELEVLRLLASGRSNAEIADELYIATSTVRSHLKSIYGKLNVHKRWDAVQRGEELGLL
jgi:LuxR family maltose regulon positive regulatory protein